MDEELKIPEDIIPTEVDLESKIKPEDLSDEEVIDEVLKEENPKT